MRSNLTKPAPPYNLIADDIKRVITTSIPSTMVRHLPDEIPVLSVDILCEIFLIHHSGMNHEKNHKKIFSVAR